MKLSKTAWLILGVGIFLLAFGSLYMIYLQEGREQERLNSDLSATHAELPELVSEKEDLESQLTQLESNLAKATSFLDRIKRSFPDSVESIEYDAVLFSLAFKRNLEITRLTALEPAEQEVEADREVEAGQEVESATYDITSFGVEVRGEVADILDLVNAIATGGDFITATVELVNISVPEPLTEEEKEELTEEEIEEAEMPSANINFVVYSYRGE